MAGWSSEVGELIYLHKIDFLAIEYLCILTENFLTAVPHLSLQQHGMRLILFSPIK